MDQVPPQPICHMPTDEGQNPTPWAPRTWLPQVITCAMLLWALRDSNPYGYYVLLRMVCCGVFSWLCFGAVQQGRIPWAWVLGITALVYNPFIPIHLTRHIWSVVNLLTVGVALASIVVFRPILHKGRKGRPPTSNPHAEIEQHSTCGRTVDLATQQRVAPPEKRPQQQPEEVIGPPAEPKGESKPEPQQPAGHIAP